MQFVGVVCTNYGARDKNLIKFIKAANNWS